MKKIIELLKELFGVKSDDVGGGLNVVHDSEVKSVVNKVIKEEKQINKKKTSKKKAGKKNKASKKKSSKNKVVKKIKKEK